MANIQLSNSFYIDTQYATSTDELAVKNNKVTYVTVTATSSNGRIVLGDGSTTRIDLRVSSSGSTQVFDFSRKPIVFTQSIRPLILTNAVVTVVYQITGN